MKTATQETKNARNLQTLIDEYERRLEDRHPIYVSDLLQIKDRIDTDGLFYGIGGALEAGFMLGYKAAQKDARQRARAAKGKEDNTALFKMLDEIAKLDPALYDQAAKGLEIIMSEKAAGLA